MSAVSDLRVFDAQYSIQFPKAPDDLLVVEVTDHGERRVLIRIGYDGSVEGSVADASEAGRLFAEALASRLTGGTIDDPDPTGPITPARVRNC